MLKRSLEATAACDPPDRKQLRSENHASAEMETDSAPVQQIEDSDDDMPEIYASATPPRTQRPSGAGAGADGVMVVRKGARISVYWPDDDEWYDGRVHSLDQEGCWVHHDDGDKQLYDLTVEQYKVMSAQASKP